MADSPSPVLQLRIQSVGSNVNLWGGYINTDLNMIEQAAKGYQSLAVTGDATVTWTSYATGNTGAAARLKLTGSPAGACVLTFPGYHNFISVENTTAQTITIKCSGGTGVAIPATEKAFLYCDGVDYYNAAPTRMSGKLTNVTAGTTATDAVNKTQMEVAIANAALPATAGTVRNSLNDTTAGYLGGKLNLAVSGALSGAWSTENPTGNEKALLTLAVGVAGYSDGGRKDAPFTAGAGSSYAVVSGCTFFLPPAPSDGAKMRLALFKPGVEYGINPNGKKINDSTSTLTVIGGQTLEITYDDTLGDWE